jgi:hypothetical protein
MINHQATTMEMLLHRMRQQGIKEEEEWIHMADIMTHMMRTERKEDIFKSLYYTLSKSKKYQSFYSLVSILQPIMMPNII